MHARVCYIVGAGSFCAAAFSPCDGDLVIAADGGFSHLQAHGYTPDLVLGDFDSLGYVPEHPNLRTYPAQKDDTDMMLAVREGLAQGITTFVLLGGTGGRIDHTLANIQTLSYLATQGARGFLIGDGTTMTVLCGNSLTLAPKRPGGTLSVFCLGDRATGVCLGGLQYVLDGDMPLGVSNAFTEQAAYIGCQTGRLLVVWSTQDA